MDQERASASGTSTVRTACTGWCRSRRPAPARRSPWCPAPSACRSSAPRRCECCRAASPAILAWYEAEGLSAFNFTVFGGALDGRETGFPVVLRVIARTAFKQDYRTDDYFLQKQLGGELMFAAPEEMAARLRTLFGG